MEAKTSELIGPALDWVVAKILSETAPFHDTVASWWFTIDGKSRTTASGWAQAFNPSTNWAHGGPILEREGISVWRSLFPEIGLWCAAPCEYTTTTSDEFDQRVDDDDMQSPIHGPTPLIAAMRCYVASKLGEEVEIPEEVLK